MGNDQMYKFCNCTSNDSEMKMNDYRFEHGLENGKKLNEKAKQGINLDKIDNDNKSEVSGLSTNLGFKSSPENEILNLHSNISSINEITPKNNDTIQKFGSEMFKPIYKRITLKDGYYEGQIVNNKFNGRGKIVTEKEVFEGDFKDGLKEGLGELRNSIDGKLIYKGNYQNNLKNGLGIEFYEDNSVYSGNFKNNLKHGKGKLELSAEKKYIGEFKENRIEGFGTFIFSSSKICQGNWLNNEIDGFCIFQREDKIHKGKISLIFKVSINQIKKMV